MQEIKPLDFVITPKGRFAIVTDVNKFGECAIEKIGIKNNFENGEDGDETGNWERSAWWEPSELKVIDSLPSVLARTKKHYGKRF